MNSQTIIFFILAAVIVISAIRVVSTRLITHAALFMALAFVAVAGVFLQLQADFLAAAQVLIYAGAITTMIIFAIMLSNVADVRRVGDRPPGLTRWLRAVVASRQFGYFPVVVAVGFAAVMYWIYGRAQWAVSREQPAGASVVAIGQQLFDKNGYVIPFEVASIVLLVAMVGAIILTAREER